MSKASGLVLILSGLAVAAYVIPPDDATDAAAPGQRTDIAKGSPVQQQVASPERTIVAPQPRPAFRPVPSAAQGRAAETAPAAAAAQGTPALSTPLVVTLAPRMSEPPAPRITIPKGEALTRELQKELRRVGCYDGEINGAWTPSTRRAMKAFTDRLNASLPVDAPDPVLYALVQGQRVEVCGKLCPTGQASSEDGRCLPAAIVARAGRPPRRARRRPRAPPRPRPSSAGRRPPPPRPPRRCRPHRRRPRAARRRPRAAWRWPDRRARRRQPRHRRWRRAPHPSRPPPPAGGPIPAGPAAPWRGSSSRATIDARGRDPAYSTISPRMN